MKDSYVSIHLQIKFYTRFFLTIRSSLILEKSKNHEIKYIRTSICLKILKTNLIIQIKYVHNDVTFYQIRKAISQET